jgi:[calcium/calmodulin-dependent protein kinase] kinase
MYYKRRTVAEIDERPVTAYRVEGNLPDAGAAPTRICSSSTPELFGHAPDLTLRRQQHRDEDQAKRDRLMELVGEMDPIRIPCPPSPDNEIFVGSPLPPSREETVATATSSSSTSIGALTTPLTSPSEVTSPIYVANRTPSKGHADEILAFQSDPSLPALLSGASSVSTDPEGEFLGSPGMVDRPSVIDTTDSLTPPALPKEPIAGFPLEHQEQAEAEDLIPIQLDDKITQPHITATTATAAAAAASRAVDDDDDASDSDDGLTMAKSRKKSVPRDSQGGPMDKVSKRRDTNASICSTDTAKKVSVHSDC